jgi:protein-L-isoaspartate(D-aspartate) O-methyltransferase
MPEIASVCQAYAQQIVAAAGATTPALLDAFAAIPREQFLGPGPWVIVGAGDPKPRRTPDADKRHVYADASVAIDAERQLFNGAPSFLARMIDSLALVPGSRVAHIGAGTGYYSAIMGFVVGATGRVVAAEIDEPLAAAARRNLAPTPWVEVQQNDGASLEGPLDAILVNAGVTHPQESWLDALAAGGRLLLPLTVAMPAMGGTLGKGVMLMIRKSEAGALAADVTSFVAIYSALGLRESGIERILSEALRRTSFPNLTQLRRDTHDRVDNCWLHTERFCLSMEPLL